MSARSNSVLAVLGLAVLLGLAVALVTFWSGQGEAEQASIPKPRSPAESSPRAGGPAPVRTSPVAEDPEPGTAAEPGSRAAPPTARESALAEALWIHGRVVIPPGAPLDEQVFVSASGRKLADGSYHRSAVAADGSFRLAFGPRTRTGRVRLDAAYLYLHEGVKVKPAESSEEVLLHPQLGGRVSGTLRSASASPADAQDFVGATVELVGGLLDRRTAVLEDGTFELRGVPAGNYELLCVPGAMVEIERDVHVAPGETTLVDLETIRGAALSGRVVDESGAPMARVEVLAVTEGGGLPMSFRDVRSAPDGGFALRGVRPGEVTLEIEHEGLDEFAEELGVLVDGEVREGLLLTLRSGGVVAGTVSWPSGAPAKKARVRAVEADVAALYAETGAARTDDQGRFRITGLPDTEFDVTALGRPEREDPPGLEDRQNWSARAEGVRAGAPGLKLELSKGLAVSGRAVDVSWQPLDRFHVLAWPAENKRTDRGVRGGVGHYFRGTGGEFRLIGLHPGRWKVVANAKGRGESEPVEVQIPPDGHGLTLVVSEEAVLFGTVLDPRGRPLEKAVVELASPRSGLRPAFAEDQVRTDVGGEFRFIGTPAGDYFVIARAPGFAPSKPVEVTQEASESHGPLVLRLRVSGRIMGELVRSDPPGGRSVSIQGPAELGRGRDQTTDGAGRFAFEDLPEGRYEIAAAATDAELAALSNEHGDVDWQVRRAARKTASVELGIGESAHVVLGAESADGIRLRGRVTRGGQAAQGVRLQLTRVRERGGYQSTLPESQATLTDAAGRYEVVLAQPGTYYAKLTSKGSRVRTSRRIVVADERTPMADFEIGSGLVAGRVIPPEGDDIDGVRVQLRADPTAPDPPSAAGSFELNSDGRFAFGDLPAGVYLVVVGDGGMVGVPVSGSAWARAEERVVLAAGQQRTEVELRLVPGASIAGTVRLSSGQAAASGLAFAQLDTARASDFRSGMINREGSYRISGLEAGRWTVHARSGQEATEGRLVDVALGKSAELDLRLEPGGAIRVRVETRDGSTFRGPYRVIGEDGRDHFSKRPSRGTDDPSVTFGPLLPGSYTVQATLADETVLARVVKLDGSEQVVEVLLSEADGE